MKPIDPKEFGLHSRVKLVALDADHLAVVKKIKSRIIMKDGQKILEQVKTIKAIKPAHKVSLIISGPICSKTLALFKEHEISVIQ